MKPGLVAYVVAEGRGGFPQRVRAIRKALKLSGPSGLYVLSAPVQMQQPAEVEAVLRALKALPGPLALVILDTLARCFVGGEENSAKDMGRLVAGVDRIRDKTRAAVLLVHHTDKQGKTERGSSALRGAVDTVMRASKSGNRVTLSCEKQKEADEFEPLRFQLQQADTGSGDTSCVLYPMGGKCPSPVSALSPSEKKAFKALPRRGLNFTTWWKQSGLKNKSTFDRARTKLLRAGIVEQSGKKYRPTKNRDAVDWNKVPRPKRRQTS